MPMVSPAAKPIQKWLLVSSKACAGYVNARSGLKWVKAARMTSTTEAIITVHMTTESLAMFSTRRHSIARMTTMVASPTRSPWPWLMPGHR